MLNVPQPDPLEADQMTDIVMVQFRSQNCERGLLRCLEFDLDNISQQPCLYPNSFPDTSWWLPSHVALKTKTIY